MICLARKLACYKIKIILPQKNYFSSAIFKGIPTVLTPNYTKTALEPIAFSFYCFSVQLVIQGFFRLFRCMPSSISCVFLFRKLICSSFSEIRSVFCMAPFVRSFISSRANMRLHFNTKRFI